MSAFSAVVVAAGGSQRFKQKISTSEKSGKFSSKVLLSWKGKPLFIHAIQRLLERNPQQVALVVRPDDLSSFEEILFEHNLSRRVQCVPGGARRQDSVRCGLLSLDEVDHVAIHDAARPVFSIETLDRLLGLSLKYPAVIPVVGVTETVKEIDEEGLVVRSLDRSRVVRVQTPQIFQYQVIRRAHERLATESHEFTDDAMMCEFLGVPVRTCDGDIQNVKVTTPHDVEFLDRVAVL